MPFKSKAERGWMFANHPEMARRWAAETPDESSLPEHVGDKMNVKTKAVKSDPRMAGLQELSAMLSDAISGKLKGKLKSKKENLSKAKADAPETELGANGEAADEKDPRAARRKAQFGAGTK